VGGGCVNPKTQATNHKQIPNTNVKTNDLAPAHTFGLWGLGFVWDLVLEIWDFIETQTMKEPRNPFYFLLMAACIVFVATSLAYVVVPWLEDKAAEARQPAPPSAWRESLRDDGWIWLFSEAGAIGVLSICAMGLDRLRSLRKARAEATILPQDYKES
jgi:hypothetical protein